MYKFLLCLACIFAALAADAQVENAGAVRKRTERDNKNNDAPGQMSSRMQTLATDGDAHEADLQYMRQIYRRLDLSKPQNAVLYFPEDVVDGQQNLFRIILNLVVEGKIPAYEFLDGREVFTEQYRVNIPDMLERFGIYAQEAKGSTEKNPKFLIEEADVPTAQVQNYYILEKWEFDRRSNRMKTRVQAICPVLSRSADFGDDARYPMFWVKYDAIKPWLMQQYVFTDDDNNLAQYSIDDYFNRGMYDGEIYKTKNLRNLTMAQMFPDEDDMRRAQDSIDNRLKNYGKNLWVPNREEYLAMREKEEAAKANGAAVDGAIPERATEVSAGEEVATATKKRASTKKRGAVKSTAAKKQTKEKKPKVSNSTPSSSAAKSVRRRKR